MTQPEPIPTWARAAVYLFGAIVGGCALAASGFDLYGLAISLGFVVGTALAVPIGLDAGAVVCGVRWITAAPDSPERARWRNATLGLVAASSVLNGLSVLAADHWIAAALRPVDDVGLLAGPVAVAVAVVIAAAFPLVAAWMVHAILEVRDAAARSRGQRAPKAPRRRLLRLLLGALTIWARERAVEARARRALIESQHALLLSPPVQEEQQEQQEPEQDQQEPEQDQHGHGEEEAPGGNVDPTPQPPPLTGRKLEDAQAWYRWAREGNRWFREHRRRPLPVDANRHIGSDTYVKGHHIEQWESELASDPGTYPPLPTGPVSVVS